MWIIDVSALILLFHTVRAGKYMRKILFIDDEKSILDLARLLFCFSGFEIITANSGKKAVEILLEKDKRQQINIIFLDLTMPEMDGLEVLRWMREQDIRVPTILQTGISDQEELDKAFKLGIKDFLLKPYTKDQVHEYVIKYANASHINH